MQLTDEPTEIDASNYYSDGDVAREIDPVSPGGQDEPTKLNYPVPVPAIAEDSELQQTGLGKTSVDTGRGQRRGRGRRRGKGGLGRCIERIIGRGRGDGRCNRTPEQRLQLQVSFRDKSPVQAAFAMMPFVHLIRHEGTSRSCVHVFK